MAVRLRFVDKIDSSPTTRLDLNDGTTWHGPLREGSDFSPPELKRAIAESLLRDGEAVPASAYANRTLQIALIVTTADEDALGTALQNLDRELNRTTNILEFRSEGATSSVFFRTFRSPRYQLDVSRTQTGDARVTLDILAEPFAYGTRVAANAVTVDGNPAGATNGLYLDVTGVLGDVETPAYIQIDEPGTIRKQALAIRRHGTPSDLTFFRQAESMTLGTDTTSVADSGASASNVARVSFATTTAWATRLTTVIPKSSMTSAEKLAARGRYRLFAVVKKSVSGDTIKIRVAYASASVTNDAVTLPAGTDRQIISLGLIEVPVGGAPAGPGYSGLTPGASDTGNVEVQATLTSGSGTLDIDFVAWFPADEGLCIVDFKTNSGDDMIYDGPNDACYLAADDWVTAGTHATFGATPTTRSGGIPLLAPNQTNRLFLLLGNEGSSSSVWSYDKDVTASIIVHHWPRWLYIRP